MPSPSRRALVVALHLLDRSPLPYRERAELEAEVLDLLRRAEPQKTKRPTWRNAKWGVIPFKL